MAWREKLALTTYLAPCVVSVALFIPILGHAEEELVLEEVHVTGTRIVRANLISPSPITQIDSQEILLSGITRVEDLLKNLPQAFSTENSNISLNSTGTATVNLRNLGSSRTLVLVDGRRLPSGSPYTPGSADINQIPAALIKRVEVLTGGASATYGSDALAGVINFYTIDDHEGITLDYQFSQYSHDNDNGLMEDLLRQQGSPVPTGGTQDGDTSDFALIAGRNVGGKRGNLTGYLTYRDIDAISQGDRINSACPLDFDFDSPGDYLCGGSRTIAEGYFRDNGVLPMLEEAPDFDLKVQGDQFVPVGDTVYNYAPLNYFQRPDERWTAGVFGHYEFNEHFEAYTQLMYTSDKTVAQIAPGGLFGGDIGSLSCGNPLLSSQQFDLLCGSYGLGPEDEQLVSIRRRDVEGGPRRNELEYTSYRGVIGLRGQLDEAWRYDVYGQYAEVDMDQTTSGNMLVSRIERALDVTLDPQSGQPTCVSVLDGSDPGCVPWNIFRTGGVTPEAIDYLSEDLNSDGGTDQTVISAYLAADLKHYGIQSPFAVSGVDLVLGAEYRDENLDFDPDANVLAGDVSGLSISALNDGFDVYEIYTELSIPLAEGRPMAESLTLDLGYRYSDYSTGETTDTFKIAGIWSPLDRLQIRASFQRAVRMPNVQELFVAQEVGDFFIQGGGDPCAGNAPAASFEDCAASGVTEAQYGNIPENDENSYNSLVGGNPDLEPEKSDTRSIGFLYWPAFLDGLAISVDWYDIEIKDAIDSFFAGFTFSECLSTQTPGFCDRIHRNRERGDLFIGGDIEGGDGFVEATKVNASTLGTSGYDVILDYALDIGAAGSLTAHNILSYVDDWQIQQVAGASTQHCAGRWGFPCDTVIPDLRNHLRLTWFSPWGLTLSGLWRHIGEIESSISLLEDIDAYDYFDLSATWEINDRLLLRGGINNLFDEDPPLVFWGFPAANGNTLPGLYDALGQYWFAGLTISF